MLFPQIRRRIFLAFAATILLGIDLKCVAQTPLVIYTDGLVNGWQDGSYNCTRNFATVSPSPVHSGSDSVSATIIGAYGGIQLNHSSMTNTAYASISFWLHGGISGGQQLQMYGNLSTGAQGARYHLSTPVANTWQQYIVPLSALGVANAMNFTGFAIQDSAGTAEPTFYLDDIQLITATVPALVHVGVNAGLALRVADARWFGLNTAIWDSYFDTPTTSSELKEMGTKFLRGPGGSTSDEYHWFSNKSLANTWTWQTSFANFTHIATNVGVQTIITVNYGSGSTNEAAAWVAYANAAISNPQSLGIDARGTNWQTAGYWASLRASTPLGSDDGENFLRISRSAPLGFKYWEVGNECYGTWETDSNIYPHDPYTYGVRAAQYITLMKAVDPTIKIGVPVVTGEDSNANGYSAHPAYNVRTGTYHSGWTPVVLTTMKSLGVTPDFLVHHVYPEYGSDSDQALLQDSGNWAGDANNLRQMITDYVGNSGTNIELLCTENNADAGSQGKQSTSIVNGLYLADSLAQLMKTEFNSFVWWDLRNGQDTGGDFDASLYGWRTYGDLGVIGNLNTRYPTFYTFKLMQYFACPGDSILNATSDYSLLSTYATRKANGALTLLVINKSSVTNLNAQITLTNFSPWSVAIARSFGIAQDEATRTNSIIAGAQDIATNSVAVAGTNFATTFPPYSLTLLTFAPAAPALQTITTTAAVCIFQLQGQAGVPYVIQSSTDLHNWNSVTTNTPSGGMLNVTNAVDPSLPAQFWRAVWLP